MDEKPMTFPTRELTEEQIIQRLKEWNRERREVGLDTITPISYTTHKEQNNETSNQ